jgi:hypothetical protein
MTIFDDDFDVFSVSFDINGLADFFDPSIVNNLPPISHCGARVLCSGFARSGVFHKDQ